MRLSADYVRKQREWDEHGIEQALSWQKKSRDSSTKCGCYISGPENEPVSAGYNGIPRGIEYEDLGERLERRPEKYYWFVHAEENALLNAARKGTSTIGCTAYVSAPPCATCARMLIQAGIRRVFWPKDHELKDKQGSKTWTESCARALEMFALAGIEFEELDLEA